MIFDLGTLVCEIEAIPIKNQKPKTKAQGPKTEPATDNGQRTTDNGQLTTETMFLDLSHTIYDGMITYKGLPGPSITDFLSREASRSRYEAGTEFHIGKIEMITNTGTYLDSPFHRFGDGEDLSGLKLEALANLNGLVLRKRRSQTRGITVEDFAGMELEGKAVLLDTGWDEHWRTDHYASGSHPFLTEEAAIYLSDRGVVLVGIDSFNLDDTSGGGRPAHTILLANGIPIVEHLCRLNQLPDRDFKFFAVPPKVSGLGSFPVRAFAIT